MRRETNTSAPIPSTLGEPEQPWPPPPDTFGYCPTAPTGDGFVFDTGRRLRDAARVFVRALPTAVCRRLATRISVWRRRRSRAVASVFVHVVFDAVAAHLTYLSGDAAGCDNTLLSSRRCT